MANINDYKVAIVNNLNQINLTIQAGDDLSEVFTCGGTSPLALILPSNFTTSNLVFLAGLTPDISTFAPISNFDGTALAVAGAATQWLPLLPSMFNCVPYFALQTTATQVSTVNIQVVLAPIFQGIHG